MHSSLNKDKFIQWDKDIDSSVNFYNQWFLSYAPKVYKKIREGTSDELKHLFQITNNMTQITTEILKKNPNVISVMRMTTCPPIARDRLTGLSGVSKNLIHQMEKNNQIPKKLTGENLEEELKKVVNVIRKMLDLDIFIWIKKESISSITQEDLNKAFHIISDRLCSAQADPILRNAQEKRQLDAISTFLTKKGFTKMKSKDLDDWENMPKKTFTFHKNVQVKLANNRSVNIPIDIIINNEKNKTILIEAKSAGDFTNTNKRRKEEAVKAKQLKDTYGIDTKLYLFLCGYFDRNYLEYESAEDIDWFWEHRIEDLMVLL